MAAKLLVTGVRMFVILSLFSFENAADFLYLSLIAVPVFVDAVKQMRLDAIDQGGLLWIEDIVVIARAGLATHEPNTQLSLISTFTPVFNSFCRACNSEIDNMSAASLHHRSGPAHL
jgi:hypothetical protein